MHLLVVTGSFPLGVHSFVTREVAGAQVAGHRVTVLAATTGDPAGALQAEELGVNGLATVISNVRRSPLFLLGRARFMRRVRRAGMPGVYGLELAERRKSFFCRLLQDARLRNVDLVHTHFVGWGHEVGIPLARVLRKPATVTAHNVAQVDPALLRSVQEGADRVVLVSEAIKRLWVRHTGSEAKLVVVPNGVDLSEFGQPVPQARAGPARLVSVARLDRHKRIGDAVEAIGRLIEQGIDCQYEVLGDGPERTSLAERVQAMGLQARVSLVGAVPHREVRRRLAEADLLIHPSGEESFGLAVAEAMATGLPIVAAGSPGVKEVVDEGRTGILYPTGDVAALVGALEDLCRNPARRVALGAAGRRRVAERFSWDQHMKGMLSVWEACAITADNNG